MFGLFSKTENQEEKKTIADANFLEAYKAVVEGIKRLRYFFSLNFPV